MSPEDLLSRTPNREDLPHLFDQIWEKVRPLYAGQPKSAEAAQALSLAEVALKLAMDAGDQRLLLEARHMMGRSLGANEEFEKAVPFYRQVIAGFQELGDAQQAARLHLALIGVLLNADRYVEAFEAARIAENLFRKNQDDTGLARLYHNIANIYHRTDDHARAHDYYLKAYTMFEALGDERAIAHSCFNLGNALAELDQFEKSEEMYDRSIQLSHELGMIDLWTQAHYNRAYLYYLRGRYSAAIEGFSRLRQKFEEAGSVRHRALCDLDESEIYGQLNLSSDAAVLAAAAAERFEQLGLRYEQAKATVFYGVALMQLGRFSEAVEAFGRAQQIFETGTTNRYWIGVIDLYRAEVHFALDRYWEARAFARRSKTVFEELGIPSKTIFSLVLTGRVALAMRDLGAAERCTREIESVIKTVEIPLVLFPYHVLSAEIAEQTGRPEEARRHYEAATEELEQHHVRLHHDDLRATFFKGRHRAYEALVRLSLDTPDSHELLQSAYAWCERARSHGLIELLSQCAPTARPQVEASLLARLNRLREELHIYYARSNESRSMKAAADFKAIEMKEKELARVLRDVSAADPEYASLQQVSIADLESVQALLSNRTTLIEYFTIGDEVLAFIISAGGVRVVRRLCPATRVLALQQQLGTQLERFKLGRDYVTANSQSLLESTRRHLQDFFNNLMAPFIGSITSPHLIIVPHGSLHFVPFHAFYDGENYLIDEFEVSYAPSASILKYCLEKQPVPDRSPLLVQSVASHNNPMFSTFKFADRLVTASDLFSMSFETNLVTLTGCELAGRDVTRPDDLLVLTRGFLYAGARSLLLGLWVIDEEAPAALMGRFLDAWQSGEGKSAALRSAMLRIRHEYPNPFHWAPLVLVGNS